MSGHRKRCIYINTGVQGNNEIKDLLEIQTTSKNLKTMVFLLQMYYHKIYKTSSGCDTNSFRKLKLFFIFTVRHFLVSL